MNLVTEVVKDRLLGFKGQILRAYFDFSICR